MKQDIVFLPSGEQRRIFLKGTSMPRPFVSAQLVYETATQTASNPNAGFGDLLIGGSIDACRACAVAVLQTPPAIVHTFTGQRAHLEAINVSDGAIPHTQQLVQNVSRQIGDGKFFGAAGTILTETTDAPLYDAMNIPDRIVTD